MPCVKRKKGRRGERKRKAGAPANVRSGALERERKLYYGAYTTLQDLTGFTSSPRVRPLLIGGA
eukprot:COSAG02_NODE_188_length_30307_cov_341.858746_17_plen_64_part_00